jgi:phage regulator Rha-like protein
MNELTLTQPTMTSWEISNLVDVRHDNVRRSIENLAESGVISLPPKEVVGIQRERREEMVGVYLLSKRDSIIVVARLCPEYLAKVVDRWQELEGQARAGFKIPESMHEALRLAADMSEQKALVEAKLAIEALRLAPPII